MTKTGDTKTGDTKTGEIIAMRRMTVADWAAYVDSQLDAYDTAPATLRSPSFTNGKVVSQ